MFSSYQYVTCDGPMKLGKPNWFIAIALGCGFFVTGCSPLPRNHDAVTNGQQESPQVDNDWDRAAPAAPPKTKGLSYFIDRLFHNDSAFFNDKSHEIEESLY